MYTETRDGMLRQILLIEIALGRVLTDIDEVRELRPGLFYINPDEIVSISNEEPHKVSYFILEPEIQQDIWLNYGQDL